MAARAGHDVRDSLWQHVARLRPGSSCMCCGAPMQGPKGTAVHGTASGSAGCEEAAPAVIVHCPECGCEVIKPGDEEVAAALPNKSPSHCSSTLGRAGTRALDPAA